jgi:hypothetical protein
MQIIAIILFYLCINERRAEWPFSLQNSAGALG